MSTLIITIPDNWDRQWPCTRGVAGHTITVTYDHRGDIVDIVGDWPELTGDELSALEGVARS